MSDTSRLFTALILSMATIFAWNYFYVNPKVEKQKAEQAKIKLEVGSQKLEEKNLQTSNFKPQTKEVLNPAKDVSAQLQELDSQITREEAIKSPNRAKISTDRLHGSINLEGGMIDDLTLAKYRQELDENSAEVVLLSPRKTEKQYFLNTGWLGANVNLPTDNSMWKLESGKELTSATPVTLSFNNGAGLVFKKTFSIDDKYLITVKQSVQNNSGAAVSISNFGLINRAYDMKQSQMYVSHEGPFGAVDKKLEEAKYKSLADDGTREFKSVSGWVAMGDKYWLTSIIPQNSSTEKSDIAFKYYQKNGVDRFQSDILSTPISVAPAASHEYIYNIYAGAKQIRIIEQYQESLNIDIFDRAIDFGSLYFLTKPILKALIYFHSIIGNMGLAIMLLTIVIRLILFPLANKSYGSMARMKKHMPEITAIKDKYKSDKQKVGTEMMKYYKAHKINPAAGCLPILVQIPVFFALYKVLYVTIEMRHEPFFAFVQDLSAQDPTNIFTLFGLVAWNVPSILPHIGILPILYSLSMAIQQRLNPPMADESQKIVMAWMPWIFLFIFANFASGLVIYWIWNNILSILQQYVITRKVEEDKNE